MIIFSDSRDLIFNSRDPNQVPKHLKKTLVLYKSYEILFLHTYISQSALQTLLQLSASFQFEKSFQVLTPWELGYDMFILSSLIQQFCCFWLLHQQHSSSSECARELFKPSKDSASLWVCSENHFFGFGFFVGDVISEVGFWPIWLMLPGLGPNR